MVVGRCKPRIHCPQRNMGYAVRAPFGDLARPVFRISVSHVKRRVDAECCGVAARIFGGFPEHCYLSLCLFAGRDTGIQEPAVAQSTGALYGRGLEGAEPNRYRLLHRQWIQSRISNRVPLAVEIDDFIGPKLAHEGDLFFDASRAVPETLSEGVELQRVPSDPDTQTQPSAAQDIQLGRLFCDKDGRALRQDQNSGRKLQLPGHGGHETE